MFNVQSFLAWQSKLLMSYKHLSQAEDLRFTRSGRPETIRLRLPNCSCKGVRGKRLNKCMKINEITNASDILALWKLISDNTWAALKQQAEAEAREKAEKAAKSKSTKGNKRAGVRRSAPIALPKPKPPAVPAVPQAAPAVNAPVQQPAVALAALPTKGAWGASQVPVAPTPTSLPTKPVAPSADALQKAGTQLKLSARHKGVVRV